MVIVIFISVTISQIFSVDLVHDLDLYLVNEPKSNVNQQIVTYTRLIFDDIGRPGLTTRGAPGAILC